LLSAKTANELIPGITEIDIALILPLTHHGKTVPHSGALIFPKNFLHSHKLNIGPVGRL
jgi:hypothetical protein